MALVGMNSRTATIFTPLLGPATGSTVCVNTSLPPASLDFLELYLGVSPAPQFASLTSKRHSFL